MKVRIPTPLYSYTGNRALVDASGSTLEEVSRNLDRQFPGIRFRMIDEQDQIRVHMKIFISGIQAQSLTSPVAASDEIFIIQALSGG